MCIRSIGRIFENIEETGLLSMGKSFLFVMNAEESASWDFSILFVFALQKGGGTNK